MSLLPFESELRIEAAGLRQGGRRLFHLALQRISRGQTPVRLVSAPADVDCLVVFLDSRVDVAKAKFCVTQSHQPQTNSRIAWTSPHRLFHVGYRLFVTTQDKFGVASRSVQRRVIRLDGQSGFGGAAPPSFGRCELAKYRLFTLYGHISSGASAMA